MYFRKKLMQATFRRGNSDMWMIMIDQSSDHESCQLDILFVVVYFSVSLFCFLMITWTWFMLSDVLHDFKVGLSININMLL